MAAFVDNGSRLQVELDGSIIMQYSDVRIEVLTYDTKIRINSHVPGTKHIQFSALSTANEDITQTSKALSSDEAAFLPPIMNLIYKSHSTSLESDLRRMEHRLRPNSTILLQSRGLGLIEDMHEVYKDPARRPTFLVGWAKWVILL